MDNFLKGFVGILSVLVAILLFMAVVSDSPLDSLLGLLKNPFATAFSAELVLGILIFAIVIFLLESNALIAMIWIALLFVFGNVAAGMYLITRFNYLKSLVAPSGQ